MRVHDSQAHRKMDVTRERILELREILLSFQTGGFSLVNATVVCAVLESISGFKPSQPQRIISGLKETFIKRYIVERTNKAKITPEEYSEKAESSREIL